ncbi:MAG: LysR family transcriptional regulator [Oscillospiraceae bacterium]|nr:LysR family transcriptional regulator [Oscillospiraceae bacterium]
MELKQLQYFLAAAESLNFSRAAENLYVSQPNPSYQIAELEQELGAKLFVRDRRRVFLTPTGGALIPLAQKILADTQDIYDLAQKGFPQEEETPPLSIAFDRTEDHFETTGITEHIAAFHMQYPHIGLELHQANVDDCVQGLLDGTLDVGVLILHHNRTLPPPLASRPVHRDNLILVVRDTPDITTCAQALDRYSLVLADDHSRGSSRMLRCFKNMGIIPTVIHTDSIPVSFVYVQAGIGAICIPRNYFNIHRYQGMKAIEIREPGAKLLHVLAWNKQTRNPSIQLLLNAFPGEDAEFPDEEP